MNIVTKIISWFRSKQKPIIRNCHINGSIVGMLSPGQTVTITGCTFHVDPWCPMDIPKDILGDNTVVEKVKGK